MKTTYQHIDTNWSLNPLTHTNTCYPINSVLRDIFSMKGLA